MPKQSDTEWATIGNVVALFGVHGELKVRLLTDIPNRLAELDAVYIGPDHVRYHIASFRPYKGEMVLLKLEGIDNANAAEPLRNLDLQIPLIELAALPANSYYLHDIIGLEVSTIDGRDLGKIIDIMVTGSNDVYIIKAPDGREILIPAIKDVIKQVDLIHRTMSIDPMAGLLDDEESSLDETEQEEQTPDEIE